MLNLLLRRLIQLPIVLLVVTAGTFGLSFAGGGPLTGFIGADWTTEDIEQFSASMGFDRPWYVQYADYVWNALQGNFGDSYRYGEPALGLIVERLPTTLAVTVGALLVILLVAIPAGVLAATHRGRAVDSWVSFTSILAQSAPTFWVSILAILIFSVQLRWFPVSGGGSLAHYVLPSLILGFYFGGRVVRLTRSSMLEILPADYVRTARAKGLSERRVEYVHALRNAAIPVSALVSLDLGNLLGGAIVIEAVFGLPGVGNLALNAVMEKDLPLVQAVALFYGISFVVVNLLAEMLYRMLDPRIRES